MPKMKHLLRKLHIGSGLNEQQRLAEAQPVISPSPNSNSISNSMNVTGVETATHFESYSVNSGTMGRTGDVESFGGDRTGGDEVDFSLLDEEFQMQLALAISASDPETVQIDAAKKISLAGTDTSSFVEFLSLRYWNYNAVNYNEKIVDGFYDVYGIASTLGAQGKMPSLVDLRAVSVSDNVDYQVILVNRLLDPELQALEKRVYNMHVQSRASDHSPVVCDMIQKIAEMVVNRMGGPVADAEEMLRLWTSRSCELRSSLNTIILPLGRLDVGLSRHRALLFKVLADRINLPCMLVKGSYYTGTDDGAVNLIRINNGSEYIIDLMGAPGTLIPAEVPSSHLLNSTLVVRGFADLTEASQGSCFLFDKGIESITSSANLDIGSKVRESCSADEFYQIKPENILATDEKLVRITSDMDFSKESALERTETAGSGLHMVGNDQSEKIYPIPREVSEWEIPWEDLQIGERIGIGSYGEVYKADWNGTEVAVKKFLDQDFSGDALVQFKCEVEIMLRLRHPNVVLFMGAVTHPPHFSILTEYLPRGSLYPLLHRANHQLDERRRMQMALDVAKGMNYLHTRQPTIVHRDLKTPNLLVDKNWVVKVCDFGLSRSKHHTFLSSNSSAGTPEWMAPEILRNEPADEKCDVYSFGVILWELVTLQVPWKGLNPMQVVGAVGFQNRHLEIPEHVDPMIAQIIRDCWQKEPHLRPSFGQLMIRLRRLKRKYVRRHKNINQVIGC